MRPTKEAYLTNLVQSVTPLTADDVGSPRWFQQQEALETLHREATIAIRDNEEEVVWELLTDADKVPALVFQLLVLERWHSNQIPKFVEEVDLSSEAGLKLRFIIQFEATLADLISLVVYHKDAASSLGTSGLDLLKWCRRRISMLLALGADDSETVINTSTEDTLAEKDPELAVAHKMNRCRLLLSSLAILRSLVEFSSVLPLEFLATVADKSVDIPFALTLLLESAPWLKMDSILGEEYAANMVDSTAKVTRYEAQVWMALYCCLTDPDLRSRYEIDVERRDAIMQMKELLVPAVLRHLPQLRQLIAIAEEVSLMEPGTEIKGARSNGLVQEITPGEVVIESALKGGESKWFTGKDPIFAGYVDRYVSRISEM